MTRRLGGLMASGVLIAACLVLVAPAWGDGLPVPVEDQGNVVSGPSGDDYFVARPVDGGTTLVRRRAGFKTLDSITVDGKLAVPAVAIDGTASGLSADEATLVLLTPRRGFPREETTFAILDTQPLAVRDRVTLRGDFSFDAISPDGSLLYFIHYTSPRDPTAYEVRAFDVSAGALTSEPVVDPDEPDEQMGGYPLTRVMSPDGRWAYTLYDGGGKTPFVHALDTSGQTAHCLDLDGLRPARLGLDLSDDGGTLVVTDHGKPARLIDTDSFEISKAPVGAPPPTSTDAERSDDGADWLLVAIVVAGAVAAASLAVRHYRNPAST